MVLWLGYYENDYAGFLVLHRDGNDVYAHGFPHRGINGLRHDGTYYSSSGGWSSIRTLDFEGDKCIETTLAGWNMKCPPTVNGILKTITFRIIKSARITETKILRSALTNCRS